MKNWFRNLFLQNKDKTPPPNSGRRLPKRSTAYRSHDRHLHFLGNTDSQVSVETLCQQIISSPSAKAFAQGAYTHVVDGTASFMLSILFEDRSFVRLLPYGETSTRWVGRR